MNYLICQDWINTSNNHAGIKYLCNQLQNLHPTLFTSITIPDFANINSKHHIVRSIKFRFAQLQHRLYRKKLYKQLLKELNAEDKIFIMEYMEKSTPMLDFVQQIRINNKHIAIYGLVHLVPSKLQNAFPKKQQFEEWICAVDKIITLGHSLTDYFIARGVNKNKLHTTFHYVDSYYYSPTHSKCHDKIKVIAMGNQMRNITLLEKIVTTNSNVDFTICQGMYDMSYIFKHQNNVTLIPFVKEEELRCKMNEADISLNVMEDTIGSNVIVTSLAMGLAMICSNVGSIRDYCDESNTIFCQNNDVSQFSDAITILSQNRNKLAAMQKSAIQKSKLLTIERFAQELTKL